jgi:addiction module HigA family antidote
LIGQFFQWILGKDDLKMVCVPVHRSPVLRSPAHPGEMLLEKFLTPVDSTQRELAASVHVSYRRINEIVNGRRGITPSTALRLAEFFDISAGFRMNL